jgi:hypothetical protein
MTYKCSVFGCRSGYRKRKGDNEQSTPDQPKPTLHAFPKDDAILLQWVRAIPRQNFVPTKNSRICSVHFQPSDFIEVSHDSNKSRQKEQQGKKLSLRYLKKDAVPSLFPKAPRYLSKPKRSERKTTMATAASRRDEAARQVEVMNESLRADDDISGLSLNDLEIRLRNEPTLPSGFKTVLIDQSIIIYCMCVVDNVPRISASVSVTCDYAVMLCCNGVTVNESFYKDILSGRLQTMSQLLNLMARVKAYAQQDELQSVDFWLHMAMQSVDNARNCNDDEEVERKLSFAAEQLELIATNKFGRHYSPELSVLAYIIHSTSAAAHETLLEQKVLCLPSERTLS